MKPDCTICSVMVLLFTGFIVQIVSARKEIFSQAEVVHEDWDETNTTDRAALNKLAKRVYCRCEQCSEGGRTACCACNCKCRSCYNNHRQAFQCCPCCECPCYDPNRRTVRCCPCGCKCGWEFRTHWWKKSTVHCRKNCKAKCFPAAAKVSLENRKSVAMSELQIGDKVQAALSDGKLIHSEVRVFLERTNTMMGTFQSITISNNITITLTENHLIYARKSLTGRFKSMYAEKVTTSDEVLVQWNGELTLEKVVNVSSLMMPGVYAPITMEGNIVVDGVLASCYASFHHDLAHFAMTPIRWFPGMSEWLFGVEEDFSSLCEHTSGFEENSPSISGARSDLLGFTVQER